jgi:pimeloyl-ACP methyl ester carboxylesterase
MEGGGPLILWLGGFKSDMTGAKAEAIARWAQDSGRAFLRFDYSGHGASQGRIEDGTMTHWLADALLVIDRLTHGALVLVGSSMGAWIGALAALASKDRIAGLVFIAPAPDFTEKFMWNAMTGDERATLLRDGRLVEPSEYSSEPTIITRALIEDGRRHLLLKGPIDICCPVRIIQGMADPDIPWRHAVKFAECIASDDVDLRLLKSGDHRLSKPCELEIIISTIRSLGASA